MIYAVASIGAVVLTYEAVTLSHLIVPNVWLPSSAHTLVKDPDARYVDPHVYDAEWFDAARAGRVDILQALLDAGYPIDTATPSQFTAVVLASYHGHIEAVDLLLQAGANACIADNNGNTALMGSLFKGEMAVAKRLVGSCPIEQQNNAGQTSLSFAAMFGRTEFIKPLLELGADPNHHDARGNSILDILLQQNNQEMIHILLPIASSEQTITNNQ